MLYTEAQVRALTPIRANVESRAALPDRRDVFLCHAWDDRAGAARQLHDLLEARGVSVWFSEKDIALGTSLLREIDKGLARSRVGIAVPIRVACRAVSTRSQTRSTRRAPTPRVSS